MTVINIIEKSNELLKKYSVLLGTSDKIHERNLKSSLLRKSPETIS